MAITHHSSGLQHKASLTPRKLFFTPRNLRQVKIGHSTRLELRQPTLAISSGSPSTHEATRFRHHSAFSPIRMKVNDPYTDTLGTPPIRPQETHARDPHTHAGTRARPSGNTGDEGRNHTEGHDIQARIRPASPAGRSEYYLKRSIPPTQILDLRGGPVILGRTSWHSVRHPAPPPTQDRPRTREATGHAHKH
jgi:hypothetical protein